MRIELVVDELALIGFDARDRAGIGDAVQAELARLLGTPDAPFVARLTHRASVTHVATVDAATSRSVQEVERRPTAVISRVLYIARFL